MATHTSPKPSRKHRPNTWCASAHRNGLLLFRSAGRRCRCGSLSEQSEPAQERLGSRQRCSRMSGAEQKFRQRVKKQWCNPQDKKGEGQETPKAMQGEPQRLVDGFTIYRASSDGGTGSTVPLQPRQLRGLGAGRLWTDEAQTLPQKGMKCRRRRPLRSGRGLANFGSKEHQRQGCEYRKAVRANLPLQVPPGLLAGISVSWGRGFGFP